MNYTRFYVSNGFQEDCKKLMTRFNQAEDLRFQTFCEIWKDLNFSLIFKGKQKVAELMEFCEEVLHLSKQYLFSATFKERICGLYLLYGIYYKMPLTQFKIKVKLTDWQSIMELHTEIREGEHLDANYILSKLIVDNAFHHCLFDYEYTFERGFQEKNNQDSNPYSVLPSIKSLTEKNQIFDKINTLSSSYQQLKCAASTSNTKNCDLNLFNHNFVNDVINDIHELEKSRQIQQKMNQSNTSKKTKKIQNPVQDEKKKLKQPQKDSYNYIEKSENDELQINIPDTDNESSSDEYVE